MPTSKSEAETITKIINEYLTADEAQAVMSRLNAEVGDFTDNQSLKISLQMLKAIYDPPAPKSKLTMLALKLLIGFHMLVLAANVVAIFVLPFYAPWYVALTIITLIVNFMFSPIPCPLTRLESRLRRSLGLP